MAITSNSINTTNSPINIGGWYISDKWTTLPLPDSGRYDRARQGLQGLHADDDFGSRHQSRAFCRRSRSVPPAKPSTSQASIRATYWAARYRPPKASTIRRMAKLLRLLHQEHRRSRFCGPATSDARRGHPPAKVGPIVISEIMYQPALGGDEFIELHNISDNSVKLYDPANDDYTTDNTWQFTAGVTFSFPPGVIMVPGSYVLVTPLDLAPIASTPPADARRFLLVLTWVSRFFLTGCGRSRGNWQAAHPGARSHGAVHHRRSRELHVTRPVARDRNQRWAVDRARRLPGTATTRTIGNLPPRAARPAFPPAYRVVGRQLQKIAEGNAALRPTAYSS